MSRIVVISISFALFGAFMLAAVMSTQADPAARTHVGLVGTQR